MSAKNQTRELDNQIWDQELIRNSPYFYSVEIDNLVNRVEIYVKDVSNMPILEKTYENVINQPEKTRITLNVKTKKIDIKDFTNYNILV